MKELRKVVLGAAFAFVVGQAAEAADKVTVQLDFILRGNHAIFFIGQSKGYFEKAGIDVAAINPGTGSVNTMREIGAGAAEFGFGDLPTLVIARSQNTPVVAIAAVNQKNPTAIISLKETKLDSPKDLEGKSIGVFAAGSTYLFYKAFAAANHLDTSKIEVRTITPPSQNFLLLKRVDTIPGYIDAELPELEAKAGGPGSLNLLLGSKYGVTAYGSGLITSEAMIKQKPDLVSRFAKAYLLAFQYTIQHPDEAADAIIAKHPEYATRRDVLISQLKQDIDNTFTSNATRDHGLGYMPSAVSEATVKMLVDQKMISGPIAAASAFDNSFIGDAPRM